LPQNVKVEEKKNHRDAEKPSKETSERKGKIREKKVRQIRCRNGNAESALVVKSGRKIWLTSAR